jgi:small subunit ribosomal protein S16
MLKIRLRRMGGKQKPLYRIVVSEERRTPTASALEELGYYDPRTAPPKLVFNQERLDYWQARGAQLSETVAALVQRGKARA